MIRLTLKLMLSSEGFTVHEYSSASAFFAQSPPPASGCVLLDLRMPQIDGIEALRRIKSTGRNHPVIMLSGQADLPDAVEAMKAGALDFIQKPFRKAKLLTVLNDGFNVVNSILAEESGSGPSALTKRERQVIHGMGRGFSSKEIARTLGISHRTVDLYRASAIRKLGAQSSAHAVLIASNHDLL